MQQPRTLRLPISTHIITGALGAGKTTAIAALLKAKPADEVWCLVINEAGAVGVDAALLSAGVQPSGTSSSAAPTSGVAVRELAGGCMCCALSGVTGVAIAQLVRQCKPDRLLIEPSGLGHPAALVDILAGASLGTALALQPIVCLVDATRFADGSAAVDAAAGPLFHDQVSIADVIVGSKADLCDAAALGRFAAWAGELFPPRARIATAEHGRLDPGWLGIGSSGAGGSGAQAAMAPVTSDARPISSAGSGGAPTLAAGPGRPGGGSRRTWLSNAPTAEARPAPGRPQRKVSEAAGGGAAVTCGWAFDSSDTFDRARLEAWLAASAAAPSLLRLKGVFRVGPKTWVAANLLAAAASGSGSAGSSGDAEKQPVALQEIAYRGGSRVELIASGTSSGEGVAGSEGQESAEAAAVRRRDWEALEGSLLLALQRVPAEHCELMGPAV